MSNTAKLLRSKADAKLITKCRTRIDELDQSFDQLSGTLHLAGNTARLKILFLLFEETELCVCDLSDILQMNVSAVSQHLRKLKDAGIVHVERKGQTSFYYLAKNYQKLFKPVYKLFGENSILDQI